MTEDTNADLIPPLGADAKRAPRHVARRAWFEHDRPSFRQLVKILAAMGYKTDDKTLARWARTDPLWLTGMAEARSTAVEPVMVIEALRQAEIDATKLTPQVYQGVKAHLIARLYVTVRSLPLDTVESWTSALDACDKLQALIHAESGRQIAEGATGGTNGAGSILAAITPEVNVAPFRRPNGKG